MRDEMFDRDYQFGRDALNQGIDHLANAAMQVFQLLAAIQFESPWNRDSKDPRLA